MTAVESLKQTDQYQPAHRVNAFDVSDVSGWEALISGLKKEPVDVLVNAAGIAHYSLLVRTPYAELERILDVNLKGTMLGCQKVIPKMMKQRSGCIINVSSLLATQGGEGASVYAATKAGIIGTMNYHFLF